MSTVDQHLFNDFNIKEISKFCDFRGTRVHSHVRYHKMGWDRYTRARTRARRQFTYAGFLNPIHRRTSTDYCCDTRASVRVTICIVCEIHRAVISRKDRSAIVYFILLRCAVKRHFN